MQEYKKLEFHQLHKADIILTTAREHPISAAIRAATNSIVSHLRLVCVLLFLFFSSSCGTIYRSGFVPVPDQTVSGPIIIGSEWQEIVPPKPLIAYGAIQVIKIGNLDYGNPDIDITIENYKSKKDVLNLKDGRKTKVEAILYDDNGESYELELCGSGMGFNFCRPPIIKVVDGSEEMIYNEFPSDRTYTKLRIRSEIPLKCAFIKWDRGNNIH